MNKAIKAAGVLGAVAVLTGAFGAHGLKSVLDEYSLGIWHTAVLYQFVHALALFALGFAPAQQPWRVSYWAWIIGTLLFSGSLYSLALSAPKIVGIITPVGGIAFCIGWFNLLRFNGGEIKNNN
ncbi:MAG TPA: DUF423 domain-containing protein [Cellvibrionaceae bacterium]